MKNEESKGQLLVVALIIFSISIAILHINKTSQQEAIQFDMNFTKIDYRSLEKALDSLQPLIDLHNIPLIAQAIAQFPETMTKSLLQKIIENKKASLNGDEALHLLFHVACHFSGKKNLQFSLFDLLYVYPAMQREESLFLVLARSAYQDIIPELIQWTKMQEKMANNKEFLIKLNNHTFKHAIADNDLASLELLAANKLRITQEQATHLLRYAVEKNKNTNFVPFFVGYGANINYTDSQGNNLLMHAVKNNNVGMTRALLEAGAIIDISCNDRLNPTLQLAIERGYHSIESLLRKHGT